VSRRRHAQRLVLRLRFIYAPTHYASGRFNPNGLCRSLCPFPILRTPPPAFKCSFTANFAALRPALRRKTDSPARWHPRGLEPPERGLKRPAGSENTAIVLPTWGQDIARKTHWNPVQFAASRVEDAYSKKPGIGRRYRDHHSPVLADGVGANLGDYPFHTEDILGYD